MTTLIRSTLTAEVLAFHPPIVITIIEPVEEKRTTVLTCSSYSLDNFWFLIQILIFGHLKIGYSDILANFVFFVQRHKTDFPHYYSDRSFIFAPCCMKNSSVSKQIHLKLWVHISLSSHMQWLFLSLHLIKTSCYYWVNVKVSQGSQSLPGTPCHLMFFLYFL